MMNGNETLHMRAALINQQLHELQMKNQTLAQACGEIEVRYTNQLLQMGDAEDNEDDEVEDDDNPLPRWVAKLSCTRAHLKLDRADNLDVQLVNAMKEVAKLRKTLDAKAAELNRKEAELNAAVEGSRDAPSAKRPRANTEQECSMREELSDLDGQLERNNLMITDLESTRDALREELKRIKADATITRGTNTMMGAELRGAKAALGAKDAELLGAKNALSAKDAELEALSASLEALRASLGAKDAELLGTKDALSAKEAELLGTKDAELLCAKDALSAKEADLEALRASLGAKDAELLCAKDALSAKEAELLSAKEAELQALSASLGAKEAELLGTKDALSAKDAELLCAKDAELEALSAKGAMGAELEAIHASLGAKDAELLGTKDALSTKEAELEALRASLSAHEAELVALRAEHLKFETIKGLFKM